MSKLAKEKQVNNLLHISPGLVNKTDVGKSCAILSLSMDGN